jgi:ribosomal protein S19
MNYNITRSSWKVPLIKKYILKKNKLLCKKPIKVLSRSSLITPNCLGLKFLVHNGKNFTPVDVKIYMIGCKFGEFALTRQKHIYKKK